VVKHFKWIAQGKRRLHQKPNAREIGACLPVARFPRNRGRSAPPPALLFVQTATKSKQKMPFHCVEHGLLDYLVHQITP
jgi:hypothetical protein